MHHATREIALTPGTTFTYRRQRGSLLALSASLGVTLFLSACGGGDSGHPGSANEGGGGGRTGGGGSSGLTGGGLTGGGNSETVEVDPDTVLDAVTEVEALSEEDLQAALAAVDLDNEVALSGPSGLIRELGSETAARIAWATVGVQAKLATDTYFAQASGGQRTQSAPQIQWPGLRPQAGGGADAAEAFGAGWFGGSLFNAMFVRDVITSYKNGTSGSVPGGSTTGEVKASGFVSDTTISLDATMTFSSGKLSATIKAQSQIPCPDVTGLMVINSSLDVTGKAGSAYQHARFTFELIVEVDDDAKLTGREQFKTRTEFNTADSSKGYDVTSGSTDVSITEFADGSFGDVTGTYQGMTEDESNRWRHAGLYSGSLYRQFVVPELQTMLDAGRCVAITVEPSAGPLDLEPFSNVDLLTKPRAKISSSSDSTGGTVKATFKQNSGGAIAESGDKVPADATFHYIAPLDYARTEIVTFEARSNRGTGKLDYKLTTSPHAD